MYIFCMKGAAKLTAADREFFTMVAQAAFANPFSQTRLELDRQIAGAPDTVSWDELVEQVVSKVGERLARLTGGRKADLRLYTAEDREILRMVFLFDVFHRCRNAFDAFILRQIEAGDAPCQVPFARDIHALLTGYGFGNEESRRYFAIFYQVRRAFYFIENALVGLSPAMHTLRFQLWNNVFTSNSSWYENQLWNRMEDFSTLLLGETGTGKGAAAAAIGRSGFIPFDEKKGCFIESFMQGFIALNLSQYPESLIESELFGHKKGAFTGAVEAHQGVLARCSPHGAIFLDEIGEVSAPVQIKLLQVLQERIFCPVGSHEPVRFRGRVIAATNRPMEALDSGKLFRADFFYRLCSDLIHVPPLRQRLAEDPKELRQLVEHLLTGMMGEAGRELAAKIESAI